MAYDNSREADMYHLDSVRKDETATPANRRRADRTMSLIKRQMSDPRLISQRERLIKANIAEDAEEARKISAWLNAYMYRKYGLSPTGTL